MRPVVLIVALLAGETTVPTEELRLGPEAETITIGCSLGPCGDSPEGAYDVPSCTEYDLHTALIEAADRGDRSALDFLRRAHDSTETYLERDRIAGVLLKRRAGDAALWNETLERAQIAVRFPRKDDEYTPEFEQWCENHGVGPHEAWWASAGALLAASEDRRSHELLLRALEAGDRQLVTAAILGLGTQRDHASLPAIERAIERFPAPIDLARLLAIFNADAADRIAFRYLPPDERESYLRERELVAANEH